MAEPVPVTLDTLADGAARELFGAALERVLANIDDPNTEPEATRTITLKVEFVPTEDRRTTQVQGSCEERLPGVKGVITTIYLGRKQGVLTAVEAPKQDELFPHPTGRPRPIEAVSGGQTV